MAKRKSSSVTEMVVDKVIEHVIPRAWDYLTRKFWEIMDKQPHSDPSEFEQEQFSEPASSAKPVRRKRQPSSWWKVLKVSEFASLEEIKKAYKEAMTKTHPDKVGHMSEKLKATAERDAKKLNSAFDEAKRARGVS